MSICWHEKVCNGYCPLFITNKDFKEIYGQECVIEVMTARISDLEQKILQLEIIKGSVFEGKDKPS